MVYVGAPERRENSASRILAGVPTSSHVLKCLYTENDQIRLTFIRNKNGFSRSMGQLRNFGILISQRGRSLDLHSNSTSLLFYQYYIISMIETQGYYAAYLLGHCFDAPTVVSLVHHTGVEGDHVFRGGGEAASVGLQDFRNRHHLIGAGSPAWWSG